MNEATKIADTKLAASTKAAIKEHFPYAVTLGDLKQCISDDPKALDCFKPRTIATIMNLLDFNDYDSPASKLSGARTFLISDGAAISARLAAGMSRASDEEDKTDIVREAFIGSGCLGFGAYEYNKKGVALTELTNGTSGDKRILESFTWADIAQELETMINEGYDFNASTPADPPAVKQDTPTDTAAFDYSAVDEDTAQYLRKATARIANSYADIGAVLAEAQERLAHNNNGIFEKWFTSLGMSKMTVYRFIQIHNFRSEMLNSSQFGTNQLEIFDNLPKMLQADISSPSAPAEAVNAVLSGDITTHKDYIALKKRIEELTEELDKADDWNEELTEERDKLKKDLERSESDARIVSTNYDKLREDYEELGDKNTALELELKKARSEAREVIMTDPKTTEEYRSLKDDYDKIARQVIATTQERDHLRERCDELYHQTQETPAPVYVGGADIEEIEKFTDELAGSIDAAVITFFRYYKEGSSEAVKDIFRRKADYIKTRIDNLAIMYLDDDD